MLPAVAGGQPPILPRAKLSATIEVVDQHVPWLRSERKELRVLAEDPELESLRVGEFVSTVDDHPV